MKICTQIYKVEWRITMKLSGLHNLHVEDMTLPLTLCEDDEKEDKKEKSDEKSGSGTGGKKNEGSPAAKAYKGTGLSQQEIADKSGLSKAEISKYKSKDPDIHRDPSVDSLKRLAKAGVNVRQMLPDLF